MLRNWQPDRAHNFASTTQRQRPSLVTGFPGRGNAQTDLSLTCSTEGVVGLFCGLSENTKGSCKNQRALMSTGASAERLKGPTFLCWATCHFEYIEL